MLDTRISCEPANAQTRRRDVDGQSAEVRAPDLAFTGVEPHPEVKTQWHHRLVDRLGAADRSCRTVERQEKPVAGRLDRGPLEPSNLLPHDTVVRIEKHAPAVVAHRRCKLGRSHDVGEQDRGQ